VPGRDVMTGQIPPYGEHFERVSLDYSPDLSNTAYLLKSDRRWYIRSDKTSHKWRIYHGVTVDSAVPEGAVQRTMTEVMRLLLDGVAGGFYVTGEDPPKPVPAITRCPECGTNLLTYI